MIVMAFFSQFIQDLLKRSGTISFSLILFIDHELLKIISQRFVRKLSDECRSDDNSIIFKRINLYIAVTILYHETS